jgi:hypothetical protein
VFKSKHNELLFAVIMGFLMVSIVSFANVAIRIGFSQSFFSNWFKSFAIGYPIAIPLILVLPKNIRKFIAKIID